MKKQYNFRIEEELLKKLEIISKDQERTVSQQIVLLIRNEIRKYEEKNGVIKT